jgi:hypothetical protein
LVTAIQGVDDTVGRFEIPKHANNAERFDEAQHLQLLYPSPQYCAGKTKEDYCHVHAIPSVTPVVFAVSKQINGKLRQESAGEEPIANKKQMYQG